MEKIFTFSKWFVLFCALLVAARLAQQYVADRAIEEYASDLAKHVWGWKWETQSGEVNLESRATVISAHVLQRGPNDGKVRIVCNQTVMPPAAVATSEPADKSKVDTGAQKQGAEAVSESDNSNVIAKGKPLEGKFSAVITLYKNNNNWFLGKVEAE